MDNGSTSNIPNTHNDKQLALLNWEDKGTLQLNQKLANFVAQMQSMMDVSTTGDYMAYIDPTIVAECIPYCETLDDMDEVKFNEAIVKFDFEDGIPIINGLPVWDRLDGEPIPYYKIFKEYRDMKYHISTFGNSSSEFTTIGNRAIGRLAEMLNIPGKYITVLSKIYHWSIRVRAYDIFRMRELVLKKQHVAEELECKHAKYSNDLLEQAMKYIKEHPANLDPKIALQMVEIGMKYGRISVGLLGDKPGSAASAVHQTNINVSQTNNTADQMLNMQVDNGGNGTAQGPRNGSGNGNKSDVERQLADNMKDNSNLFSVLHVLNKSNAFKNALDTQLNENNSSEPAKMDEGDDFSEVIDLSQFKSHQQTNSDTKEEDTE